MTDLNNIPDLDALEVRDLVVSRQISPVEVVEATLERIEKTNSAVNAICTLDAEQALDTAKSLEQKLSRNPDDVGPSLDRAAPVSQLALAYPTIPPPSRKGGETNPLRSQFL